MTPSKAMPFSGYDLARVSLRRATPDDALCLSVLGLQVWLDTYATDGIRPAIAREVMASFSLQAMAATLADTARCVEVAEHDGHLIGYHETCPVATHALAPAGSPPGAQAELYRLSVQEPFTGRGVGRLLLRAAETLARSRGASVLWLTPWVHNHRALAFYRRQGYSDFGATLFCFEGEAHENRVLAKSLTEASAAPHPQEHLP
jgi:diamine N-acetyltransferase